VTRIGTTPRGVLAGWVWVRVTGIALFPLAVETDGTGRPVHGRGHFQRRQALPGLHAQRQHHRDADLDGAVLAGAVFVPDTHVVVVVAGVGVAHRCPRRDGLGG